MPCLRGPQWGLFREGIYQWYFSPVHLCVTSECYCLQMCRWQSPLPCKLPPHHRWVFHIGPGEGCCNRSWLNILAEQMARTLSVYSWQNGRISRQWILKLPKSSLQHFVQQGVCEKPRRTWQPRHFIRGEFRSISSSSLKSKFIFVI